MITEELAAIEARANAATQGPWAVERWEDFAGKPSYYVDGALRWREHLNTLSCEGDKDTAEFIAHAREDVPALLAAVRERDNTIARIRALHVKGPSEGGCSNTDCKCHGYPTCLHCDEYNAKGVIWPCATIAALDPQETE